MGKKRRHLMDPAFFSKRDSEFTGVSTSYHLITIFLPQLEFRDDLFCKIIENLPNNIFVFSQTCVVPNDEVFTKGKL